MSTKNIIKLTTGEEIVCQITNETDTHTSIKNPLKIHTIPRFVESGIVESLALIRWVKPYTEEDTVEVKNNHILYSAKTSAGLSTFYDKQLLIAEEHGGFMTAKKHQTLIDNYHKEQLQGIKPEHDLEEEDLYDDEDKTIH
mgnify:FL=1